MDVSLCTQKIVYGTVGTAFPPCFFAWLVMFGKHWVERRDKQHLWDMISLFALRFREGITHSYLLWILGWTYSGTTALILEYFSTFFPESSMSSLFLAYLFSSLSLHSHLMQSLWNANVLHCTCTMAACPRGPKGWMGHIASHRYMSPSSKWPRWQFRWLRRGFATLSRSTRYASLQWGSALYLREMSLWNPKYQKLLFQTLY